MSETEVYLGRQPILDRGQNVVGYELLYRSSRINHCVLTDPVMATSQVIVNAVLAVGLDRLLGGKRGFVNFDRTLLLGDWTTLLPPDKAVIEILETVPPDSEVLTACYNLRQHGYALALDDCVDDSRTEAFAPFVDILKVDFQEASPADQESIVRRYGTMKIGLLAEKVETEEEFRRALHLGYDYFQGFFFARPTVLQGARIPPSQMSGLRLVKQVQQEVLNFRAIEDLIRHDVSLSHSLLTYLNSAAFTWAGRVESIRHGLFLLGSDELRKWVWMATLASLGQNRPPVLFAQVLMRGRLCETIASSAKISYGEADMFLLGMFSLLDAILGRPLQGILDDLNIGKNIRAALLGVAGEADPLTLILRLVKSYEIGDWDDVEAISGGIGMSADILGTCYLDALSWVETVFLDEQKPGGARSTAVLDFHRKNDSSTDRLANGGARHLGH